MFDLVLNKNEEKKLEALGVEALILFGSQAQGLATERSDIDIGVLVEYPILRDRQQRKNVYDALYDMISGKHDRLTDIDIVFLQDAPMELRAHVMKYGVPLYECNPRSFPRFKEYVMDSYADFAPNREEFQRGILSRILWPLALLKKM